LPPTKRTEGRVSWKFLVCHLQRRGKREGPGRFWFATEKKTGAECKGSSGLTTKKGKPRRNMILKGLRSTTDRKWPWEYLGMSKVAIFKRGSVYRDSSIPLLALPSSLFCLLGNCIHCYPVKNNKKQQQQNGKQYSTEVNHTKGKMRTGFLGKTDSRIHINWALSL